MIPTRLVLKNFLSYAELDLDFSSLHVACLSGVNGSGKSPLIEALLFAWFGVGRYKLLDEHVRLGADQMTLSLEWLMGPQRYRVIRQRSTAGRGKSEADLHLKGSDGEWVGLASGEGVTAAVASILGLDYVGLVSTAICLQNDASRFVNATAGQRKAILRAAFRLGDYEAWAKLARERVAGLRGRIEIIDPEMVRLQQLASGRPETERLRDAALEETTRSAAELESYQERLLKVREHLATLQARVVQRLQLVEDSDKVRGTLQEIETRIGTATADLETARKQAARRAELERLVQQADELAASVRMAEQVMQRRAAELREAQQAETAAETRLQEITTHLTAMEAKHEEWSALLARAEEVEAAAKEVTNIETRLAAQDDDLRDHRAALQLIDEDLKALDLRASERASLEASLEATRSRCADQVSFIERSAMQRQGRAALIETVPCVGVEVGGSPLGETCPLLKEAWDARRSAGQDQEQLAEAQRLALDPDPALRTRIEDLTGALAGKDRTVLEKARQAGLENLAILEAGIKEQKAALKRVQPIAQLAGTMEMARGESGQLDTQREAKEEDRLAQKAALSQLRPITQAAAQRLADTKNPMEVLQAELAHHVDRRPALDQAKIAEASIPALGRRIEELSEDLAQNAIKIQESEAQLALFGRCDEEAAEVGAERTHLESKIEDLKARHFAAMREHADTQALLDQFTAAETRLAEIAPSIDAARLMARRYERLLTAYQTVPILILENAIPAIEAEANALLGRISSSGLQVRLETLKAVKSKDTLSEDLNIIVRDRAGERSIEGYGGGETFRLAFALRLALSRVIAQRSGAVLDFLVIDEGGFGALDAEGLAQVLEAIHRIKDDFKLILIVSHLDTVLEGFASRIMVTKDGAGSHVEVIA